MTSSTSNREMIHVSLGSTSNAVSAHLLNLQGLAVTSTNNSHPPTDENNPICDPMVSHTVDPSHQVWVPRVLMIDEAHQIYRPKKSLLPTPPQPQLQPTTTTTMQTELPSIHQQLWSGNLTEFQSSQSISMLQQHPLVPNNNTHEETASSRLAYSPYSRYRSEPTNRPYESEPQGRHVNWDDLGDETEEEDEEQMDYRRRHQQNQWNRERQQMEQDLSDFWQSTLDNNSASETQTLPELSWMDFWMPPYNLQTSTWAFESMISSFESETPFSFSYSKTLSNGYNVYETLWEKLRHQLEECDGCRGFTLMTQDFGGYAGMTTWLLQEMQEECKSAGRLVYQIHDDDPYSTDGDTNDENHQNVTRTMKERAQLHRKVQEGFSLADFSSHAHLVLPIQLYSEATTTKSLFAASARIAMALEAATLPYRLHSTAPALIGWNSGSGYEDGRSPGMTFGDFLLANQPNARYPLLELDVLSHTYAEDATPSLKQLLIQGTSVERDQRMRQRGSTSMSFENTLPGQWLGDLSSKQQGLMTSLSPRHSRPSDRSLHRHFSLSTSVRLPTDLDLTRQQYLDVFQESMGIRYRPEMLMGTVLEQSIEQLTTNGYGAGSYWKYMDSFQPQVPVLSVLGNTTRMYPYLESVSSSMKDVLKSHRYRGLYQREVMSGILPELEDCDESLEACWNLRDTYEPPAGSGLIADSEGQYFDE